MNTENVRLKYLFELNMGQSPDSDACNMDGNGVPFLQGKADFGIISPSPTTYCTQPKKIANAYDILLSVRAPVGDMNIADTDYAIGRGLCALKSKTLEPQYAWYMLHTVIDALKAIMVAREIPSAVEHTALPICGTKCCRRTACWISFSDLSIFRMTKRIPRSP